MKIFISWSGPSSRAVAEALNEWLRKVIQACDPWMSASDGQVGDTWDSGLADRLRDSRIGVFCITPDNRESTSIHYEAGAMAISVAEKKFVCPYLFGLAPVDLKWPLARFTATTANEPGTLKLLDTINSALGEKSLSKADLKETFDLWWPRLKGVLENIAPDAKAAPRSHDDISNEILLTIREVSRQTGLLVANFELEQGYSPVREMHRRIATGVRSGKPKSWAPPPYPQGATFVSNATPMLEAEEERERAQPEPGESDSDD